MILTNRLFTRKPPSRDAKSIFIFCEGVKREVQYFEYFKEIDSRINLEIYPLKPDEDNSPAGLFRIAEKCLLKTEDNPNPKYELLEGDEVWIVLDTDDDKEHSRVLQIIEVREKCELLKWNVVESNPCFEVWLYFHVNDKVPLLDNPKRCSDWKKKLNESIESGFDSRRHPILIKDAIINTKNNFSISDKTPNLGSSEVFKLAESIYSMVQKQIDTIRESL